MYKKLSTTSNTPMKKLTRIFFFSFWADRMGLQFQSPYVLKLSSSTALPEKSLSWYWNELYHGKNPMDGIGWTVKMSFLKRTNWSIGGIFSTQIFWGCDKICFVNSLRILLENENIVETEHISKAKMISQTLKTYKLERKCSQNGDLHQFFQNCRWWRSFGGENKIISDLVETSEIDDQCEKCQESYNEREEWLCCPVYHQWHYKESFYGVIYFIPLYC